MQRRIELVREDVRRLGPLVINPPQRTVRHQDGRTVTLEPRTMQLLVTLLDADGAVLSRDDLIQSCWDGRIVGDDSISSVVYRLRRDLRGIGAGVIEIETVTKVGFRLVRVAQTTVEPTRVQSADPPPALAEAPKADPARHRLRAAWPAVLAGLLVIALGVAGWLWTRAPAPTQRPLAIASVAIVGPGIDAPVPAAIGDALRGALSDLGVPLAARDGDLRLALSVRRRGAGLDLTSRLDDLSAERTLWSETRTLASAEDGVLAGEANRLAAIVHCATPTLDEGAAPNLSAMVFRVCEADDRGIALSRARELRAAAPDFAPALVLLASGAATVAAWDGADAEEARREGLEATDRLIAIRPEQADGYAYQALLLPFSQATQREALLRRAVSQPASYCGCAAALLGDFLAQTGRLREAVGQYQQGYDRNQVAPLAMLRLILGFDWIGENSRAEALLDRFEEIHGPNPALRYAHSLYMRPRPVALRHTGYGDPAMERAVTAALEASAGGSAQQRDSAATLLRAIPVTRKNEFPLAALLAELGDGAGALAVARHSRRAETSFAGPGRYPGVTTALLWDPRLAAVWREPGFGRFLAETGYIAYWRASRSLPDICRTADAPAFCTMIARPRQDGGEREA